MNVLLIEPDYKNKYPPLGLMKLSTYHKRKGDAVSFYKGRSANLKKMNWGRVYISTLFTFHWKKTIDTINYYKKSVPSLGDVYVGGIMASLLADEVRQETGVKVIDGLLNQKGTLGYEDDDIIDSLVPDYSIFDNLNDMGNLYPTIDSYFVHATRGCVRRCPFCAVPRLEPAFFNGLSILEQVKHIRERFGEKKNLLVMDNNVLASAKFANIIADIKDAGFATGAKLIRLINGRPIYLKRVVDFNQGIDARLLNKAKMKSISEIAVEPLRIAFDDIRHKELYKKCVWQAAEFGIRILSNYILFNYRDTPDDFYARLKINVELNEALSKRGFYTRIWSFPMKYSPVFGEWSKNRKYIGEHWNRKFLRGIQCVLLATHGVVGPKRQFFERAFGRTATEFRRLVSLPDDYIIYREKNQEKVHRLQRKVNELSRTEKRAFYRRLFEPDFSASTIPDQGQKITDILKAYKKA